MRFLNPSSWKINSRLLFVSVVPILLVSSILTTYHTRVQVSAENKRLWDQGNDLASTLAVISELRVISADTAALKLLATPIVEQGEVHGVIFFDESQQRLLAQPEDLNIEIPISGVKAGEYELKNPLLRCYIAAIHPSVIEIADHKETFGQEVEPSREHQVVGWVAIIIDESDSTIQQQTLMRNAIAIGTIGLLLAYLIAQYVARSIARPVKSISDVVDSLAAGDLSTRVTASDGGEIGRLQDGVNRMAELIDGNRVSLQSKIAEATKRLQLTLSKLEERNNQLQNATAVAEAANLAKDQFLARMSHELRTPITSISGFIALMKETSLNEEQSEYVDIVGQASKILLGTINDILDLSEINQSEIKITTEEFELESALDNMISMHEWFAFEKGIELIIDIERDVPRRVKTDQLRLMQICNNLVSNSVKFTNSGQVLVSVIAQDRTAEYATLAFIVKDSGIGIEPKHRQKIFEPFYQGDTSIRRRYGGTGLGLMIAKSMVEQLGGTLEIESEPGRGTEISFHVNVVEAQDSVHHPEPEFEGTALIYDKNPWSRRSIRNRVLRLTREVFIASSEANLVEMIRDHAEMSPCLFLSYSASESNREHVELLLKQIKPFFSGDIVLLLSCNNTDQMYSAAIAEHYRSIRQIRKPVRNEKIHAALAAVFENGGVPAKSSKQRMDQTEFFIIDAFTSTKVLLAEDNQFSRQYIKKLLTRRGLQVTDVADGKAAYDAIQKNHYDIALVDLHMPEMDGFELAEAVSRLDKADPVPIILVTADGGAIQLKAINAVGIDYVLPKPFEEKKLIETIGAALGIQDPQTHYAVQSRPLLDINPVELRRELRSLLHAVKRNLRPFNNQATADLAHQIKGLTALAGDGVIIDQCVRLNDAAIDKDSMLVEHITTDLLASLQD
jgi:two-component system sensor histidine kinase BarA